MSETSSHFAGLPAAVPGSPSFAVADREALPHRCTGRCIVFGDHRALEIGRDICLEELDEVNKYRARLSERPGSPDAMAILRLRPPLVAGVS